MALWAYGLTSLPEKTRRSNHLQMLEQKHLLLKYFKTLSEGPAGNRTQASLNADWRLTNWANRAAVIRRGHKCQHLLLLCGMSGIFTLITLGPCLRLLLTSLTHFGFLPGLV